MSDDIHLEDGRTWSGSSSLVSWVLELTSRELTGPFALWLRDMANRPNGLAGFDLRGLSGADQAAFYAATHSAYERARQSGQYPDAGAYFDRWQELLRMRDAIRSGEPPDALNHFTRIVPFDGEPIDFGDLWF